MDDVREHIKQLNVDSSRVDAAWKAYERTRDPKDKQRYDHLMEELRAKLPRAGGSVDSALLELVEGVKEANKDLVEGVKEANKDLVEQFKPVSNTDSESPEDKRTRFLYSTFLAETLGLEAPGKQYGLYLLSIAGLYLLGKNLFRATKLLEVEACKDSAKKADLQDMGNFTDRQVRYAAKHAAEFRARGIAAGVGVPFLWLAWRFATRDGSSASMRNKGKSGR